MGEPDSPIEKHQYHRRRRRSEHGEPPRGLEYMDRTTLDLVRQGTDLEFGDCGAELLVEYSGYNTGEVERDEGRASEILSEKKPVLGRGSSRHNQCLTTT